MQEYFADLLGYFTELSMWNSCFNLFLEASALLCNIPAYSSSVKSILQNGFQCSK